MGIFGPFQTSKTACFGGMQGSISHLLLFGRFGVFSVGDCWARVRVKMFFVGTRGITPLFFPHPAIFGPGCSLGGPIFVPLLRARMICFWGGLGDKIDHPIFFFRLLAMGEAPGPSYTSKNTSLWEWPTGSTPKVFVWTHSIFFGCDRGILGLQKRARMLVLRI